MTLLTSDGGSIFNALMAKTSQAKELLLIAPYMKADVVTGILANRQEGQKTTLLLSLTPRDILFGSSDLEVYYVCRQYGVTCLINNRIHLKAFIEYNHSAIVGSANLTQKALGLANNYNYEIATKVDLSLDDKIYFDGIISESIEMNDDIYDQLNLQVEAFKTMEMDTLPEDFNWPAPEDHFLFSALPQSDSPQIVYQFYSGERLEESVIQCARADLRNYKIPTGLNRLQFMERLKINFFAHPFIHAMLEANDSCERRGQFGMQFGALKKWIQDHTTTVPVPRRQDITEPLQNILTWVVALGEGRYKIEIPGRQSQVLRVVSNGR